MNESPTREQTKSDPKLRHEFVGMMFAVTIGEVGLQAASLVKAGNWVHFLPAYSHLFLATVMIAASWVGWTRSPSPGARQDVSGVFQPEFLVLLVDVLLVIIYFILVKEVDFTGEQTIRLNASAAPEAHLVVVTFYVYMAWDFICKVWVNQEKLKWSYGVRMVPTVLCLVLAKLLERIVWSVDAPHVLTADMALLALVLLFRALKAVASAFWPSPGEDLTIIPNKKRSAISWTAVCLLGMVFFAEWTRSWPMFECIAAPIRESAEKTGPRSSVERLESHSQ